MLARKFDLPVVPIHIRARNSALFYLFDAIHPTLRDITLFHETLNKTRQPFRIRVGAPIPPHLCPTIPNRPSRRCGSKPLLWRDMKAMGSRSRGRRAAPQRPRKTGAQEQTPVFPQTFPARATIPPGCPDIQAA